MATAALLCALPAASAAASLRDSLGASVDDRYASQIVGRFQADNGELFVVDRAPGRGLLLRFDRSPEIWVLHPTAGPRGDVIYKNDVGEPVLRQTRVGGLTLFTLSRPGGVAAAFMGGAPPLRPQLIPTTNHLLRVYTQASARVGRMVGRVVLFEAVDAPIAAVPMFADAADLVTEAFAEVAGRGERRPKSFGGWRKIEFVVGKAPDAEAKGDTLRIVLAPERGLAGRPSSRKIAQVIARR